MNEKDGKSLFLFTKVFPFYKEEQYLEDELPFLLHKFNKIIIIPCSLFEKIPSERRNLPDAVDIFPVNMEVKQSSLSEKLFALFCIIPVLFQEIINNTEGIRLYSRLKKYLFILNQQIGCAFAIRKYCRKNGISDKDAVFYSYWLHNSCIILGILKKLKFIKKFATRAHSYDLYHDDFYPEAQKKSPLAFHYFKVKSADRIYSVSEHGRQNLMERFPGFKTKFSLSRLGVTIPNVTNPWSDTGPFRMVSCSTVQELKRVYRMPEILSHLDFETEWVHFGSGNENDMQKLNEFCRKYKKQNIQINLKGYTSHAELLQFYSSTPIHLFMNLSLAEGVPVSLMEAASYGIPLLVTDVYGSKETVCHDGGYIVPKDFDPEHVASCIRIFRQDNALQMRYRNNIRKHQEQYFNSTVNFASFATGLYESS